MSPTKAMNIQCMMCRERIVITVPSEGYRAWQEGALIQDAMPDTPVGVRELLISKVCSPCFDSLSE